MEEDEGRDVIWLPLRPARVRGVIELAMDEKIGWEGCVSRCACGQFEPESVESEGKRQRYRRECRHTLVWARDSLRMLVAEVVAVGFVFQHSAEAFRIQSQILVLVALIA